ncbi:RHS repeat-associated core domain-containing protein [Burkholderia seminalis]|uniref:RHS repeat-associated core domain-containing protein n=1 Tax=Burkholderia TaxID=32008 RepID=UPI001CF4D153|nr:RHS repeat-associated core domain-containing protein [Burkholderia seminalis]
MTDASANVVWDNLSDPFGNPVAVQGTTWANVNWRGSNWASTQTSLSSIPFPGQYFDSETELAQNWYRDYDLSIGRYLQSDPIGLAGGINTYAYVGGQPTRYIDSTGLQVTIPMPVPPASGGPVGYPRRQNGGVDPFPGASNSPSSRP